MFGLGFGELVVILFVVVLLFGGKKLPELGKSMGKAISNFKAGMNEGLNNDQKTAEQKKIDDKNQHS